jgi:phage-related minor tail protein
MPGWFGKIADAAELSAKTMVMGPVDAMASMSDSTEEASDQLSTYARRQTDARSDMTALTEAIEDQEDGIAELTAEWKTLLGTLDTREAFDNLDQSLNDLFDAGVKAFGGSAEEVRKFNSAQKDSIDQIADLAIAMDLTFGEQNKLKIFVDSGDLIAAAGYLKNLKTGYGVDLGFGVGIVAGKRAMGGPVAGGSTYLVGERGPELFTPSSSGNITPNGAMGGNTITVNVNGGDPNSIVRALQQYVRQSGPIPVNTRAM